MRIGFWPFSSTSSPLRMPSASAILSAGPTIRTVFVRSLLVMKCSRLFVEVGRPVVVPGGAAGAGVLLVPSAAAPSPSSVFRIRSPSAADLVIHVTCAGT